MPNLFFHHFDNDSSCLVDYNNKSFSSNLSNFITLNKTKVSYSIKIDDQLHISFLTNDTSVFTSQHKLEEKICNAEDLDSKATLDFLYIPKSLSKSLIQVEKVQNDNYSYSFKK